jgi:hypothetical protein
LNGSNHSPSRGIRRDRQLRLWGLTVEQLPEQICVGEPGEEFHRSHLRGGRGGCAAQGIGILHNCDVQCPSGSVCSKICEGAAKLRSAANSVGTACRRSTICRKRDWARTHLCSISHQPADLGRSWMPLRYYGCLSRPNELVWAIRFYPNRGGCGRRPSENVPRYPNDSKGTAVSVVDLLVVADVGHARLWKSIEELMRSVRSPQLSDLLLFGLPVVAPSSPVRFATL